MSALTQPVRNTAVGLASQYSCRVVCVAHRAKSQPALARRERWRCGNLLRALDSAGPSCGNPHPIESTTVVQHETGMSGTDDLFKILKFGGLVGSLLISIAAHLTRDEAPPWQVRVGATIGTLVGLSLLFFAFFVLLVFEAAFEIDRQNGTESEHKDDARWLELACVGVPGVLGLYFLAVGLSYFKEASTWPRTTERPYPGQGLIASQSISSENPTPELQQQPPTSVETQVSSDNLARSDPVGASSYVPPVFNEERAASLLAPEAKSLAATLEEAHLSQYESALRECNMHEDPFSFTTMLVAS
eukprot:COSAG02_NODE_1763_length_11027_cov_4.235267_8_plen_303_part_00